MTTKELMELLAQCDPDEPVYFSMDSGCCGDSQELESNEVDTSDYASTAETKRGVTRRSLSIRFGALPGYYSCRQVGDTLRSHNEYWTKFNKPEYVRK